MRTSLEAEKAEYAKMFDIFELTLTCISCPLQIEGRYGDWKIYYRERHGIAKTYVYKGALVEVLDKPDMTWNVKEGEVDNVAMALGRIALAMWMKECPEGNEEFRWVDGEGGSG